MVDSPRQATELQTARPSSVDELSAIVRGASAVRKTLEVRAGGTHRAFGNSGLSADTVIDITGLDRVIDYSAVDLTLAVEAGVRLSAIDRLLAENDQRLVFDAPQRNAATIGGCFAVGLSGPRRLRYGSLKDMVIGLEVVNNRGEVTKSGGMVVKNVSGYELARLHYGAHGAFGIISRVNLKVLPAVESRVEATIEFEGPEAAIELGSSLLTTGLDPTAVYALTSEQQTWMLRVQFEGSSAFAAKQAQRMIDHVKEKAQPLSTDIEALDRLSTPAFDEIVDLTDESASVARVSLPASKQSRELENLPTRDHLRVLADLGSGLVYVRCNDPINRLDDLAILDAPTTFLALPKELKVGTDVFGDMDANARRVVNALKVEFDPEGILNPGRFAGFL